MIVTTLLAAVGAVLTVCVALTLYALVPSPAVWMRFARVRNVKLQENMRVPMWMPLAGSFGELTSDLVGFFSRRLESAWRFGMLPIWFAFDANLIVSRPDDIKQFLFGNDLDYSRDNTSFHVMHRVLGKGIINATGQDWRDQHKILYKAFSPDSLVFYRPAFAQRATKLIAKFKDIAKEGKPVNLLVIMNEATLGVMIDTAFGNTLSSEEQSEMRHHLMYAISQTTNFVHQIPVLCYIFADGAQLERRLSEMHRLAELAMHRRREGTVLEASDIYVKRHMIDLILEANQSETEGYRMPDDVMRDNMINLMAAGTETTATAMTWTLYFLHKYPEVRRKVLAENKALDLHRLEEPGDLALVVPYLTMVIYEGMRMRAPLASIPGRRPLKDTQIGDIMVPKQMPMITFAHHTHHNPHVWDSPEEFRPERFTPKVGEAFEHRAKFVPFGLGRRYCLGKYLAMAELQVMLSHLVRNLHFEYAGTEEGLTPAFRPPTVQPRDGMWMNVKVL
eukprot:m.102753 g.102753  ORF g.102753 m.102753 type:complete len:505 (-) comp15195_c0_seq1:1380-2894(-)